MPGDLERGGRDVCMPERQSDRDLYWGPDLEERGGVNVLLCSCPGERTACVWGTTEGVGLASDNELGVYI